MSTKSKRTILNVFVFPLLVLSVIVLCGSCTKSTETTETTETAKTTEISEKDKTSKKSGEGKSSLVIPVDPYNYCPVSPKEFKSWFVSGVVTKNGVVKHADSLNFPTKNTNCDFYKWAMQMFLWILSPSTGSPGVFDSATFYDVAPAVEGKRKLIPHEPGQFRNFSPVVRQNGPQRLPVIAHPKTGMLMEIDSPVLSKSGKQLVKNSKGEEIEFENLQYQDKKIVWFDKKGNKIEGATPVFNKGLNTKNLVQQFTVNKLTVLVNVQGDVVDETEQGQAGGNDVLMTQKGSLVYYTILVNDVYAVYKSFNKDATKFPDTKEELEKIVKQGKSIGINITDQTALAMELKMSWIKVEGLPDADHFVQTRAKIPTYKQVSHKIWVKDGEETATLALVGVHVVGNVMGHPEMLWSTFEHVKNAPLATYSYINTANKKIAVESNTSGDWIFAKNGATGPFNKSHMKVGSKSGIILGSPISPSNTRRENPWGVKAGTIPNPIVNSAAQSNSEILSINNNVMGKLKKGDVRKNYIFIGNTWTDGGVLPTGEYPKGNEVGTSKLANSTMETYFQPHNCFFCHSTQTAGNFTGLSHIFSKITPLPGSGNQGTKKEGGGK